LKPPSAGSLGVPASFTVPIVQTAVVDGGSSGSGVISAPLVRSGSFSIVLRENAASRRPPNHFDVNVCSCSAGVATLDHPPAQEVVKHPVEGVEGAFVLSQVCSPKDCEALRAISEAIGYTPDIPLSCATSKEAAKLQARPANVVLLASAEQQQSLWRRVKDCLPAEVDGDQLFGLNPRWRLYRCRPGDRCSKSVDGPLPMGGCRPSGEYLYDAHDGRVRSHFTLILCLSTCDIEEGGIAFYEPSKTSDGKLEVHAVRLHVGQACIFAHGEKDSPLLYSGLPSAKGIEYTLRTEVCYESSVTPAEKKAMVKVLRERPTKPADNSEDDTSSGDDDDADVEADQDEDDDCENLEEGKKGDTTAGKVATTKGKTGKTGKHQGQKSVKTSRKFVKANKKKGSKRVRFGAGRRLGGEKQSSEAFADKAVKPPAKSKAGKGGKKKKK